MTTRFELVDEGFADPCLTTWPRHHIWSEYFHSIWSGRRGSNSLPPPWQGGALPDELRPHIGAFTLAPQGKTTRIGLEPTTPSVTGWCSNQLSYRAISGVIITTPLWSGRRGSNSLPPPWQGGALPDELRPHMFQSLQATFVIITDLSQKVKGFLAFCSTFFQIFFPSRYPTRGLFQLRFPFRFVAWASQRIPTFASLFLLCCILCSFPASLEANKLLPFLFFF